ncbi:complement C3-like [Parambassis ranga]|uniref:Complement C3-like n=1 Tax=Parambassis ranga TaxID=210632 RepID=A0A6P7HNQ1_9TELE|nr:complement C3-like [Parambassis ranga]
MRRTLLLLLASLASLTSAADGAPLYVLSAPNLLRVGTTENIFVECQDCSGRDIDVHIRAMTYPNKRKELAHTTVTLYNTNSFQAFGQIAIPLEEFSRDPTMKQYVYLQAEFPDQMLEKVVLVSFQSGYIFIQTDKTLYTPNSRVLYRLFVLTAGMEPVEMKDGTQIDPTVVIEVVTPDGVVLSVDTAVPRSGIVSGQYRLGEVAATGMWKVVAKFQSNPQQSFSAEFQVKEHVLPSLEVKLTPASAFFYVDSEELRIDITAKYLFGEEVDGTAYVLFGIIHEGQKISLPSSLQRVPIQRGSGTVTLRRRHITQTFPHIPTLEKYSIYVAVSVLTASGSEMVAAELRGIQIVQSPYTIYFTRTPKYFHPGMALDVLIEVLNPDDSPAESVPVVVHPGEVLGITDASGMARVTINTIGMKARMEITAKTKHPHISLQRQTSATMTALPYTTGSNNYIHISLREIEPKLGGILQVYFSLYPPNQNDVTYLISSRGQLVKFGRIRAVGQILLTRMFPVTKEMLHSFRIVAYYHPTANEVVSDSVWVNVKVSCMGTLRLEPSRDVPSYEPGKLFRMRVTGHPGATVGLVAVDKGVYALNNKLRLTQKKVWDIVEEHDTGCTPGGGKDSMGVFFDAGLLFETNTASGTPCRHELKCPITRRQKRELTTSLDEDYIDSEEIVARTLFHESWMRTDIRLPACPQHTPHCETTSFEHTVPLPHSLTAWQLIGISMSKTHGICVADPMPVIVRKEFFIDLKLPYSAVHGEQLEIKAILHNYLPDPVTVRVELFEEENVCSVAFSLGKYVQEVNIRAQTTQSVPFIIIPMKVGEYSIEVKAAVKESSMSDGIRKKLLVVPKGVLVKSSQILTVNPTKTGIGDKQEDILNSGIPRHALVPNTPTRTQISVTGREQVGSLVENIISGSSMGSLISQPSGSGEGNIIRMTLPVIATVYLDKTNQWETVGFQKRNEALQHIRTGYANQLAFRNTRDGSFSTFVSIGKSTWLTAYVVKVFSMARNLVAMRTDVICNAVKFLIFNTQRPDGAFSEIGRVAHNEMVGDMTGIDSDVSLTAFCLIAMQESRSSCFHELASVPISIDKAVAYLEWRLPSVTNPYAVAITSYALANENKLNKERLYQFASPELSHWPIPSSHLYTLEATGYALLALVKAKAFEDARPVVNWFNKQQKVGGGYGSTQATIIVYQAVAEYWESTKDPEYDLNVKITVLGLSKPLLVNFNRNNYHTTRTMDVKGINHNVTVIATGTGEATLTMVSLYYAEPKLTESDCEKFNLSVQLIPEKVDETERVYRLKIDVLYKHQTHGASMSVLDIGLLTGFIPNNGDLDALSRGPERTIAKYEMNTALSERGSLIIYLDGVSHTQPTEISFRLHQVLRVGILQPAAVSVYEYYDQRHCMKFYHPERKGVLLQLCNGEQCQCAEGSCSMLKQGTVSSEQRTETLCESRSTAFAYKVRLEEFTEVSNTDQYKMRVLQSIKEGDTDVAPQGKLRIFLSFPHCRTPLNLVKDKTYLIMGSSRDIERVEQNRTFQYVFRAKTWVEYWPTPAECQFVEFRHTCLGLEDMIHQQSTFGCEV